MIKRDQPFFSIIVPTYNRAERLIKALESLLNQEFKEFEIIVVDDGSTDQTRQTVEEFAKANPIIKYFFKANEERSIARNYGIARSNGKYIGFLDSDDVVLKNHLTVAFELLKRTNYPEVGHLGYQIVDDSGNLLLKRNDLDESLREKLIYENILNGNAIFIRREIAMEVQFIPNRDAILSEDWYLWLRLAARYPIQIDNTVTSSVVHHRGRSLLNIDPDKLISNTNLIVEYLKRDDFFMKKYQSKSSYHFANHYTFLTLTLALTKKRRWDTIKYLWIAFTCDPGVVFRRRFLASAKHFF